MTPLSTCRLSLLCYLPVSREKKAITGFCGAAHCPEKYSSVTRCEEHANNIPSRKLSTPKSLPHKQPRQKLFVLTLTQDSRSNISGTGNSSYVGRSRSCQRLINTFFSYARVIGIIRFMHKLLKQSR